MHAWVATLVDCLYELFLFFPSNREEGTNHHSCCQHNGGYDKGGWVGLWVSATRMVRVHGLHWLHRLGFLASGWRGKTLLANWLLLNTPWKLSHSKTEWFTQTHTTRLAQHKKKKKIEHQSFNSLSWILSHWSCNVQGFPLLLDRVQLNACLLPTSIRPPLLSWHTYGWLYILLLHQVQMPGWARNHWALRSMFYNKIGEMLLIHVYF